MRSGKTLSRLARSLALLTSITCAPSLKADTELYVDGYFRARARLYDNLALERGTTVNEEGETVALPDASSAFYLQQRLRVSPELRVNQYLSVFAQLDVLPDLVWGTNPELASSAEYYEPAGQAQGFLTPGGTSLLVPRRAWAEFYTPIGRLKVGRAGMQVGAGLFFNDGNGADSDYGDTADRVQFLTRVGPVYLLAGFDAINEGDPNLAYDATGYALAVAYRSEVASASLYGYLQDDRTWVEEASQATAETSRNSLQVYNFDLWGKATLGPVDLELEAIYRVGGGSVAQQAVAEGVDPVTLDGISINQFGGMARGRFLTGPWTLGLETGIASGDLDDVEAATSTTTSSASWNALTLDRDYNVGMLLFRVPLPGGSAVPVAPGESLPTSAKTGNALSNAFYLTPSVEFKVLDQLSARFSALAAWAMETGELYNNQKDYGYELDLQLRSQLFDKATFGARGALLVPGRVFDTQELAFGAELSALIEF